MATPPLWEIRRDSACVYIFAVRPGAQDRAWFTDEIRAALRSSDAFWRETPDMDDVERHPLLAELALADERSLAERVGAGRYARIFATATSYEVDMTILEALRPWVVAQLLNQGFLAAAHVDPALNIDEVLTAEAIEFGCEFHTELSVEEVLRAFGGQPEDTQLDYLDWMLDTIDKGADHIDRTFAAWAVGDLSLDVDDSADARRDHLAFYNALLTQRNRDWMPRFDAMLSSGKTTFVAVGTMHVVGPDSVVRCAEEHGLPIKRVK